MTKNDQDKLCKKCRQFDKDINGTEGVCNDLWVECKHEDDEIDWISVKDKHPDDYKHVLVFDKDEGICVGYRSYESYSHHPLGDFATGAQLFFVTHWKELPPIPKENDGLK